MPRRSSRNKSPRQAKKSEVSPPETEQSGGTIKKFFQSFLGWGKGTASSEETNNNMDEVVNDSTDAEDPSLVESPPLTDKNTREPSDKEKEESSDLSKGSPIKDLTCEMDQNAGVLTNEIDSKPNTTNCDKNDSSGNLGNKSARKPSSKEKKVRSKKLTNENADKEELSNKNEDTSNQDNSVEITSKVESKMESSNLSETDCDGLANEIKMQAESSNEKTDSLCESANKVEVESEPSNENGSAESTNKIEVKEEAANENPDSLVGQTIEGEDGSEILANQVKDPTGLLTNEVIEEEKHLHEESVKEEQKIQQQKNELMKEMTEGLREDRYRRLQFLLSKSNMYTQYLIDRMDRQKDEDRKRKERLAKAAERKKKDEQKKKVEEEKALKEKEEQSKNANPSEEFSPSGKKERRHCRKDTLSDSQGSSQGSPNITSSKKGKKRALSKTDETGDKQISKKQKISEDTSVDKENMAEESAEESKAVVNAQGDASAMDGPNSSEREENELFGLYKTINGEAVHPEQPNLFSGGVLREYQIEGYKWLSMLYENGVNGILADEMGLGKTVQCIALIGHLTLMEVQGPYLIVGPLSTLPNWYSEFQRFTPKIPVIFYHGSKDERMNLRRKIKKLQKVTGKVISQPVVITSYEIAMIDRRFLSNYEWKYLIVDEGHRIKNAHCRLIHELKMYQSTHRLLLTGTPLQNNLAELWSLLNFLLPEIFDDLGSFEAWFDVELICGDGCEQTLVADQQRQSVLSMLHQILTPFLLRRLKSDVDLCIPPKREVLVYAPMTPEQAEYYSAVVNRTVLQMIEKKKVVEETIEETSTERPSRRASKKQINYKLYLEPAENEDGRKKKNKEAEEQELESWISAVMEHQDQNKLKKEKKSTLYSSEVTIKMANIMMQLRKCCNHPYLLEYPLNENGDYKIDETVISSCGKMLLLDRMLTELKRKGHKVLLFSQMTKMLDIIEDYCYVRKIQYCRLDGSSKVEDRREQIDSFNKDKDIFMFLLSTRAGGLGLNLVAADTVIIYDSDWNPQCDLQAQDRCHRIGQTRPVVVYRVVTANSIDQRIVERAAAKRKLEKMVIHKGKFKSGIKNFSTSLVPMTPEELLTLLNSNDHQGEVGKEGEVISDKDLEKLLDRSDLQVIWKRQQKQTKEAESGVDDKEESESVISKPVEELSGIFKVIDEVEGRIGLEKKPEVQDKITECTTDTQPMETS